MDRGLLTALAPPNQGAAYPPNDNALFTLHDSQHPVFSADWPRVLATLMRWNALESAGLRGGADAWGAGLRRHRLTGAIGSVGLERGAGGLKPPCAFRYTVSRQIL